MLSSRFRDYLCLALVLTLLAGCGRPGARVTVEEGAGTAQIVLSESRLSLRTGEQVKVEVETIGLIDQRIEWTATGGKIEEGQGEAIFTAPDDAGEYLITAASQSRPEVTASLSVAVWEGEPFSIAVIPDIQNMIGVSRANNEMVSEMTHWLVSNMDNLAIRLVTQLGDVVDNGWDRSEWERAHLQLGRLDESLPYSVALGDHDYRREEEVSSPTRNYLEFFGPARYEQYDWYGGSNPNGTSHFQVFRALGHEFLHIALEWEAQGPVEDPSSPLGWARQVIEERAHMPTIISTHAYLSDDPGNEGRSDQLEGFVLGDDGSRKYPGSSGEDIFEALIEPHPNVFMVLNGHYHRGRGTFDGEYHQTSVNGEGQPVFEMLSNYQDYPNGGDGWLRLIEFIPSGGTGGLDRIQVRTYSPVLDQYQTDGRSEFFFDLDLWRRLELE